MANDTASIRHLEMQGIVVDKDIHALQKDVGNLSEEIYGNGKPGLKSRLQTIEEMSREHAKFIDEIRSAVFGLVIKAVLATAFAGIVAGGIGSFVTKAIFGGSH
jgi:hypothetical protein